MRFEKRPRNARDILPIYICAFVVCAIWSAAARAADPFEDIIRKTDPLTPEQERQKFHLPPGFEIQLVASEPQIGKPINMAFDNKGRLWLTQSREYPFPAPTNRPGRDAIMVLSRFESNGRADKISKFADGLNIPIGIYPYRGGAIAFSIPFVYFLQDTNSDGRADKREILLDRVSFDRDTHGLTSSFRRGYDGWIYADHGYNNTSTLKAKDGSTITMNSGNCYRFKPDGSHIEQYSWGQVNPFGLMFDSLGDLWSADCHSAPVYLLLRGAHYPSFGKKDDGLGFGPPVITHQHGSTAIAGMVYYAATNWPDQYRGNTFIGNVMTCRINRDSYTFHGSTRPGKEEPDFMSCDDPWFRPVDLQLGPDGAMYVADFYNRIIGHYEVPLDHPGRDRERGRVWRIVYKGTNTPAQPTVAVRGSKFTSTQSQSLQSNLTPEDFDVSGASVSKLMRLLAHSNITVRMLAMNELTDRIGQNAVAPVTKMMRDGKSTAFQKIHGLWVLHRLNGLSPAILAAAVKDTDRGVRTHAMRVLSETADLHAPLNLADADVEDVGPLTRPAGVCAAPPRDLHALVIAGLLDPDAFVRRAAADALGRHPEVGNMRPVLNLLHDGIAADDTELKHVVRMALRNQLIPAGNLSSFVKSGLSEADSRSLANVAIAVSSSEVAEFLVEHIRKYDEPRETLSLYLKHAVRFLPVARMDDLATVARKKSADDFDLQLALFKSVQDGIAQGGGSFSAGVRAWGVEMARAALDPARHAGWTYSAVDGMKETANPWTLQQRRFAGGKTEDTFLSSLPGGETLTGVLRSQLFTVPPKLEFYLAGHDGFPNQPAQKKNYVRLVAADSHAILAQAAPPRRDVAQQVIWDLQLHAGKQAYLEFTDSDDGTAYAWMAAGRFKPPVVDLSPPGPSELAQQRQLGAELARSLALTNLASTAAELLNAPGVDIDTRAALAQTVIALQPDENLATLTPLVGDASVPAEWRNRISAALANRQAQNSREVMLEILRTSPYRVQIKLARNLAGAAATGEALLDTIEHGQAPAQLLLDSVVKDKLIAAKPSHVEERIAQLSRNLAPASEQVQKLIDTRRAGYPAGKAMADAGSQVFVKNCSVCHSIDGHGGLVGPQLDGVGGRGLDRLMEDVLDPSRNVDRAFRTHIITLKDGDVVTGLPRREEGELLILADSTGKEISIPIKNIQARRESETSLMPDNFGDAIPVQDFYNLMAFLLSRNVKPAQGK